MKSIADHTFLIVPAIFTLALFAPPAQSIEPSTAFLLGVATTVTTYHYHRSVKRTYSLPAVVQRKIEATFPSYHLTRANIPSSRTKYLKLPKMSGHICGHDGICLGH